MSKSDKFLLWMSGGFLLFLFAMFSAMVPDKPKETKMECTCKQAEE